MLKCKKKDSMEPLFDQTPDAKDLYRLVREPLEFLCV